jgi:putative ABC transport system permease protein
MRSALGAPRGRLVQQLLTESVPLGLAAGVLGTVLALLVQRSLVAATPLTRLGLETVGLQPEVLAFALLLSLGTVLVFGLAPALMGSRVDLAEELKSGSRSVAGGRARFRSALVVAQVALSVVLLVGAALLLQSFARLRGVDPGFRTQNLLTAEIGLPRSEYDLEARTRFFQELLDRTRALPGVEKAGLISQLPMRDPGNNVPAWNPENPPADASQVRAAYQRIVMPGYFDAMDIPIVAGRDVAETDADGAVPVVLINETMAQALYLDQEPLGRQLDVDQGDGTGHFEIIGVVGDVQIYSLDSEPQMVMYFSYRQRQSSVMRIAVHTAGGPTAIVGQLREVLGGLDSDIPLAGVRTMEEVLSRSTSFQRTVAGAVGIFALVALLLAALGLYGVLAYQVTQRTHEIGIRVALGARAEHILRMVMGHGFTLVGVGLAIGVVAALGGARVLRGRLYEVGASDPVTFVSVVLFFSLVALVACLLPSWRAWRVDPVVAFRAE